MQVAFRARAFRSRTSGGPNMQGDWKNLQDEINGGSAISRGAGGLGVTVHQPAPTKVLINITTSK